MSEQSVDTRLGLLDEQLKTAAATLARLDAKTEILTGMLGTIKVIEVTIEKQEEEIDRAFARIEDTQKEQTALTKKILDLERVLESKFSFINGVLWTIAIVWTVVGGGIIWMGSRLISLAVSGH